jgi:hypothetical protein
MSENGNATSVSLLGRLYLMTSKTAVLGSPKAAEAFHNVYLIYS